MRTAREFAMLSIVALSCTSHPEAHVTSATEHGAQGNTAPAAPTQLTPIPSYAPLPTAYTVIAHDQFGLSKTIVRDGPRAAVMSDPKSSRSWPKVELYDLDGGWMYSPDRRENATACTAEPFAKASQFSWQYEDPFAFSGSKLFTRPSIQLKDAGAERVNGFSTQIVDADLGSEMVMRLWLEPTYGVAVRRQLPEMRWVPERGQPDRSPPETVFEIDSLKIGPPDVTLLDLPPPCARLATLPEADRVVLKKHRYVNAEARGAPSVTEPPGVGCRVLFEVLHEQGFIPYRGIVRAGLDRTTAVGSSKATGYEMRDNGYFTAVTGAGAHRNDNWPEDHDGKLRIPDAPPYFHIDLVLERESNVAPNSASRGHDHAHLVSDTHRLRAAIHGGEVGKISGLIHRQCSAAGETRLLYLVADPEHPEVGKWVWEL